MVGSKKQEYGDSWPKILLFRTFHLWNFTTELILISINKPFMSSWWTCWVPLTTLVFICFRLSNFGLDMVNLSLMKVVISVFSVVSKDSEDSSFELIDVVASISSVVSLIAHQFGCVEIQITSPYNNQLLIWNHFRL